MAVSNIQDANGNLQIFLTASELEIEANELICSSHYTSINA
jgi:hypothetical protein